MLSYSVGLSVGHPVGDSDDYAHGVKPRGSFIAASAKYLVSAGFSQAIIGSANINDRSLLGERDSEIAKVVNDQHFLRATFDGKPVKAGLYVSSLRRWIFREHLGVRSVEDPVADKFYYGVWKDTARRNTHIFEEVFRPLPTDHVTTFAELRAYTRESPLAVTEPEAAAKKLDQIVGHLVELPEKFLENECLTPAPTTKESLMPTRLWT